jgi:chaperonin cofactor prefoldin
MKMIEYFRQIKLHHKQVAQMDELIIELRAKQKVLNQRVNILTSSEKFQKNSIQNLYANIYKTIDKLIVNDI